MLMIGQSNGLLPYPVVMSDLRRRIGLITAGTALLVGSGVLASRGISEAEEDTFRTINEFPEEMSWPLRGFMQYGTFGTVPALAGLAWWRGRRDLSVRLAAAGTAAWIGAKFVKRIVSRGRPAALHPVANLRGNIGGDHGWISGHSAVATAISLIATPELPRVASPALTAAPAVVGFARIYVGAHEPLDVVGGIGFGMILGGLLRRSRASVARRASAS
jgi:membrane-associated phospholipid phosphatase